MSNPPKPEENVVVPAEPSSPTSSVGTIIAEPRRYTRSMNVGLGDRLANARNLPPPPLTPRTVVKSFNGGFWLPSSSTMCSSQGMNRVSVATDFPQYSQHRRYSGEKGVYRSSYNYPVFGHELGGGTLSPVLLVPAGVLPQFDAHRLVAPAANAPYLQPASSHGMSFVGFTGLPSSDSIFVMPKTTVVQPPPDVFPLHSHHL